MSIPPSKNLGWCVIDEKSQGLLYGGGGIMTTIEDTVRSSNLGLDYAPSLWHEVEQGFWVANSGGVFLGTIERQQDGRYFARGATSVGIGKFPTLVLAQMATARPNG